MQVSRTRRTSVSGVRCAAWMPGWSAYDLAVQHGRHTLGPHVVGQRVVVRRAVPGETGPSGGPAMSDVLGECLAWGDDVVVRKADGEVVRIPVAEIVTGKPVPARASVRHRVSAVEAERHGLGLWSGVEIVDLGEWALRHQVDPEPRLYKRANSVLAVGDPGMPLAEAIAAARSFYVERDRQPLAQVIPGGPEEQAFLDAGWVQLGTGATEFRLGSLAMLRRLVPRSPEGVGIVGDKPRVAAEIEHDGRVVARGEAYLDRDWLGLHSLQAVPEHRGRGLSTRCLAALVAWGAERGATTVWLHVEADNQVARDWYERLDLRVHHEAAYLTCG